MSSTRQHFCEKCGSIVQANSEEEHQACVHRRKTKVTYLRDAKATVIERNGNTGCFHCPCGLFHSVSPEKLRRHSKQHMSPLNEARAIAAYRQILHAINIKFNKELGAIICLECASSREAAIIPQGFIQHVRQLHEHKRYSETLLADVQRLLLHTARDPRQDPPRNTPKAEPTLPATNRFRCCVDDCVFVTPDEDDIPDHCRYTHCGITNTRPALLQCMYPDQGAAWFEVQSPRDLAESEVNV
ncbi:Protein of unknown function [Pyronema omphalodes CBS 100304]|uniref:Uncharacterized protein n=1 Tax=Pyronema omphalodes (strain CBS 100304) TaxID=1076935 RepID=U4L033_PYROM|nr:Protein of unknown function [Pyronema omphalodes CBS 100304]